VVLKMKKNGQVASVIMTAPGGMPNAKGVELDITRAGSCKVRARQQQAVDAALAANAAPSPGTLAASGLSLLGAGTLADHGPSLLAAGNLAAAAGSSLYAAALGTPPAASFLAACQLSLLALD
jgi:hypothetical protein